MIGRAGKKREKVLSKYNPRDVMYMEFPSMPLWDAFAASAANQEAIRRNEVTSSNLRKYLKVLHDHHTAEQKARSYDPLTALPPYLERLLSLQGRSGAFDSLAQVCVTLGMPLELPWRVCGRVFARESEKQLERERATALAVALMRQHNALFEVLVEAHDRACAAVPAIGELVYEAKELINEHFQTVNYNAANTTFSPQTMSYNAQDSLLQMHSLGRVLEEEAPEKGKEEQVIDQLAVSAMPRNDSHHYLETKGLSPFVLTQPIEEEPVSSSDKSTPPMAVAPTASSKLASLWAAVQTPGGLVDEEAVQRQREIVTNIENEVVMHALKLEQLVLEAADCLSRCVALYNAAELMLDRHSCFDELTARISDGYAPTPAFIEPWKKNGVPGIRPTMLTLLLLLGTMADERLTLSELLSPLGRDWKKKTKNKETEREINRSRFILIWNGHNVALKALHW